jgi:hypothetical protein
MSQAVAKQTQSELPVLPKAALGLGTGLSNVEEGDLLVPRISIASGNCKALAKGTEQHVRGLTPGDIYNTVTGHIYGEKILIAPLWFTKNRILFDPDWKIECSSPDGKTGGTITPEGCKECVHSTWGSGENGVGTSCTLFLNFAVAILGPGVAKLGSISFKNTSSRVSDKWNSLIEGREALNPDTGDIEQLLACLGAYEYSVVTVPGKKGAYYAPAINNAEENKGSVPDKDVARVLELYMRFKTDELEISSAQVNLGEAS